MKSALMFVAMIVSLFSFVSRADEFETRKQAHERAEREEARRRLPNFPALQQQRIREFATKNDSKVVAGSLHCDERLDVYRTPLRCNFKTSKNWACQIDNGVAHYVIEECQENKPCHYIGLYYVVCYDSKNRKITEEMPGVGPF